MATQYFPIGYPIAEQVVATPHGTHRLELDEWVIWQQTFVSHSLFQMADDLLDLLGVEDTMERQLIEYLLKLMVKTGLVVAIPHTEQVAEVLADYRWMSVSEAPEFLLNDQQAGVEILFDPARGDWHRMASHSHSFHEFLDQVSLDPEDLLDWLIAGIGTLGFLVPTRRAVDAIRAHGSRRRKAKIDESYDDIDLFDLILN